MSTGAFTLSDIDPPAAPAQKGQYTSANIDAAPAATIGPDQRGFFQKLNDWYTNRPVYEGTLDEAGRSIQDKVHAVGQGLAVASVPALVASGIAAPAATALGLGGGALGATVGSAVGKKAGEAVGAPELGEDLGGVAGGVAGGAAGSKVAGLLEGSGTALAKKIVAPIVKKPLGATIEDLKFGRDPAQAIVDEGLVGTKETMAKQADQRLGDISDATDQILQKHSGAGAKPIDVGPIIDSAINDSQAAAKKVGNKATVSRLEDLREALKNEYGKTAGTPFEMNNLKREIGSAASDLGAFKATDPVEASAAAAMARVYTGIKEAVNKQVPDIAPLNERAANLISARTALKRNIALETNKSFLDNLTIENLIPKVLAKTAGSAPVRSGAAKVLGSGAKNVP